MVFISLITIWPLSVAGFRKNELSTEPWTVRTTNPFRQLLPKEEDLLIWKEYFFPFQKNYPLLEDTKFKLSLYMSLVLCALGNASFNQNNHISKLFTKGFENVLSVFFNSENLLSSIEQCMWLHLYFPFRKFYLDMCNKMADNNGTALLQETDFDISKDPFRWINIFIRWSEDYQLFYQFIRLLL